MADNQPSRQGDVLFAIDPEPYRIALAQADAALAARAAQCRAVARRLQPGDVAQEQIRPRAKSTMRSRNSTRQPASASKGINTKSALDQAKHDLAKAKASSWPAQQGIASAARRAWRRSRHRNRQASGRAGSAGRARQGGLRSGADDGHALRPTASSAQAVVLQGRPVRRCRHAAVCAGRDRRHLGRGQFQGDAAHQHEARPEAEIVLDTYPGRRSRPRSTASAPARVRSSRCCRRRTRPATGSRSPSAFPVRLEGGRVAGRRGSALRTGMSAAVTVDTGASRGLPAASSAAGARRRQDRAATSGRSADRCPRQPRHDPMRSPASRPDHAVDHAGDDHAGARHHDRQRRAADHDGRPRRLAGQHHLGADLLHRRRGDHDAGHRLACPTASAARSCS